MIIDGKKIAEEVKADLKAKIANIPADKRKPGLAVILVGDDPASHFYVGSKQKSCEAVGIESFKTVLAAASTQDEVIATIEKYNQDEKVDGILLQLPLPDALKEQSQDIINIIKPEKDADGLTTFNQGLLLNGSSQAVEPCTPKGCMELLSRINVDLAGKKALVVGRSLLVGRPISLMLNQANATVTMAHSRTKDLAGEVAAADILVAAIGKKEFIKGEWIKPGAVVIDVGINAETYTKEDDTKARKLYGDVEFAAAEARASYITPVPGGVGPMTVAMLLVNTFELYQKRK